MKSFFFGVITVIAICIISLITHNWVYIYWFSGNIGVLALIACGIAMGAFQDVGKASYGGEAIADKMNETEENKDSRIKWATRFLLFGLPNVIAAAIYIYFVFIK